MFTVVESNDWQMNAKSKKLNETIRKHNYKSRMTQSNTGKILKWMIGDLMGMMID